MGLFTRKPPEQRFWDWFLKHERALNEAEPNGPSFQELARELRRVHEDLVWEVSVEPESGKREFIISADGLSELVFAVETLADAAPPLKYWKVIRFRPRAPRYAALQLVMGDRTVGADDIEVTLSRAEGRINLVMHIRSCPEPDHKDSCQLAFLMLDTALGEYDAICKMGSFRVVPFEMQTPGERVRWQDFRERFDAAFEQTLSR